MLFAAERAGKGRSNRDRKGVRLWRTTSKSDRISRYVRRRTRAHSSPFGLMLHITSTNALVLAFRVHIHLSDPTGPLRRTFIRTRAYLELTSALTWRVINATELFLVDLLRGKTSHGFGGHWANGEYSFLAAVLAIEGRSFYLLPRLHIELM